MSKERLKILCFHGYRQCGESFRQKTGSLRKALKNHADLYYLTAPLRVKPLEGSESEKEERGWWFSREDDYFSAKHVSDYVKGFQESLESIEKYVKENGPYDGFLGFSQGAAMVALLCSLQETGALSYSFKFAIIVAGFMSQSSPHKVYYNHHANIPSLHVIGETDQVIGKQMSIDLLEYFNNPETLTHPGGHFVPASGPQKQSYIKFLEPIKQLCNDLKQTQAKDL